MLFLEAHINLTEKTPVRVLNTMLPFLLAWPLPVYQYQYLFTLYSLIAHFQIAPVTAANSFLLSWRERSETSVSSPPQSYTAFLVPSSSAHCNKKGGKIIDTGLTLGPFIRGKIRPVLNKTRTFRINGTFNFA